MIGKEVMVWKNFKALMKLLPTPIFSWDHSDMMYWVQIPV